MATHLPIFQKEQVGCLKATILSHLGNIAIQVGRSVKWDAARETIADDPQAEALLRRSYRAPYQLPEV